MWEEICGLHFYTLMVQKKALQMGTELAEMLGDNDAANYYKDVAMDINTFICDKFYLGQRIISSVDITNHRYIERHNDFSILMAFIHTDTPFDARALNTLAEIVRVFSQKFGIEKSMYLMGRYPDDEYCGGNPWVLTTTALVYVLMTIDIDGIDQSNLSQTFFDVFNLNLNHPVDNTGFRWMGLKILEDLMKIEELNRDMTGLSFAEQIDKDTLAYRSVDRLAWNYVELLRAVKVLSISV